MNSLMKYFSFSNELFLPPFQEAQCGEGTRTRNVSCIVSDGSADDFSKVVDEEFCADIELIIDGNKNMVLEETCTEPCPGNHGKREFIF